MDNKKPNKILVYGLPRTGTTILQQNLSQLFLLKNRSETYYGDVVDTLKDVYVWTSEQNQSVMKLLTTNVINSNIDIVKLIIQGNFDLVVIPVGKNLVDSCVSLYYAERITQKYHYYKNETPINYSFTMDLEFVKQLWIPEYQTFLKTITQLDCNGINYITVNYNEYIQNAVQNINGVNMSISDCYTDTIDLHINYATLCRNYADVENLINQLTR